MLGRGSMLFRNATIWHAPNVKRETGVFRLMEECEREQERFRACMIRV